MADGDFGLHGSDLRVPCDAMVRVVPDHGRRRALIAAADATDRDGLLRLALLRGSSGSVDVLVDGALYSHYVYSHFAGMRSLQPRGHLHRRLEFRGVASMPPGLRLRVDGEEVAPGARLAWLQPGATFEVIDLAGRVVTSGPYRPGARIFNGQCSVNTSVSGCVSVHAFHSVLQPGGGTVLVVERGGPQSGTHVVAIRDGFGTELAQTVLDTAPGRALAWKTALGVVLYEPRARNFVFQPATPPVSRQAHALREFDGRVEYRRAGDEDFQPLGPRSNPFERLCNAGALIELRLRLEGGDATRPARIGRGGAIRVRHGGRTILRIAVDGGGVISVDGD